MKTLPLALGLAGLVAAAVFATLYVRASASQRVLVTELSAARARAAALDPQLAAATAQSASLEQRLTELDADLGATKTRLTGTDVRNVQLARELVRAQADLATRARSEQVRRDELAALNRNPPEIGPAAGAAEDVAAYKTLVADLERQLAESRHPAAAPTAIAKVSAPAPATTTKPAASVVGIGPANAFVILNYGAGHGAATGQAFAIRHGRDTVALARVTDVRPRFSIAHVQPNSLRGVLQKGDSAVLTD